MKTYLMYDGSKYKIGQSKDPIKRMSELKTANPDIRLIAFGNKITETELHKKYSHKRYKLEFFKLSNKDVSRIISLLGNEYNGIQSNPSYDLINFGKYNGLYVQDLKTKEHIKYMKWYIANSQNAHYLSLFKAQLIKSGCKSPIVNLKHKKAYLNKLNKKSNIEHSRLNSEYRKIIN